MTSTIVSIVIEGPLRDSLSAAIAAHSAMRQTVAWARVESYPVRHLSVECDAWGVAQAEAIASGIAEDFGCAVRVQEGFMY
jgi:hypothetical protein